MESPKSLADETAAAAENAAPPPVHHCPFDFADGMEFDPQLRALLEREPVARIRMAYGEGEAWLVTRYEDVRTVTTDKRFSRAAVAGRDFPRMTPEPIVQREAINVMDPPASSRLRKLVAKGFAPRRVDHMRRGTQRVVDRLLDELENTAEDAGDWFTAVAQPLPLITICEVLDIPESDRPWLRRNALAMMNVAAAKKPEAVRAKAELRAYFGGLTAERRRRPGPDLISSLAVARDDAGGGGDRLSAEELTVMAMVLLVTGQDTTTYQLGNLMYALLTRPALVGWVRGDLGGRLPRVLDELLRFLPFRKGVGIPRVALEDVELGGRLIREGDVVHVSYLTANRDGRKFERPDEVDPERSSVPHMTFGWGGHHCLGAPLAAMELETALGSALERFPELRLAVAPEAVQWNTTSIWRHPLALPVAW